MSEHAEQPHAAGEERGVDAGLATSGAITYLHIPATEPGLLPYIYVDHVLGSTMPIPHLDHQETS